MGFFSNLNQTLLSVAKIALQSCWRVRLPHQQGEIVVLGNGPSLSDTIKNNSEFLAARPLLAVNFAACAKEFFLLRPRYYLLADPHFFTALDRLNVQQMWSVLTDQVDWPLTLFVPWQHCRVVRTMAKIGKLDVRYYNMTPVEGFKWFENAAFSAGLGMPRPRNVLIPSIMVALKMGFKTIYLAGADHSWTRTLSVDDNNRVVSIQPHFYKEDEQEAQRALTTHMGRPLHVMMWNFYVAFRSYWSIERYARHIGAQVLNITPGSFIDAFPRHKLN